MPLGFGDAKFCTENRLLCLSEILAVQYSIISDFFQENRNRKAN